MTEPTDPPPARTGVQSRHVHIDAPCFAKHPQQDLWCTREPGHEDAHLHPYTHTYWPNTGRDLQW